MNWLFKPDFNRAVKVCTTDQRITSDAGLLLLREADHRLGLAEHLAARLVDPRRQDPDSLRLGRTAARADQRLCRRCPYVPAMGYSTQDDAGQLAHDPAMKLAAWNASGEAPVEEQLVSQPMQSRWLGILARFAANRAALLDSLAEC